MGTQPETTNYDATVYEWELGDPVKGGPGGIANKPVLQLADRTNWLKAQLASLLGYVTANVRTRLTQNLALYVNPSNGSDNNSGVQPTLPLQTLQAAWNIIANEYDLNGYTITINLAFGTYAPFVCSGVVGQGNVNFVGSLQNQSSCVISAPNGNAVTINAGCAVGLSGIAVTAAGSATANPQAGFGIIVGTGGRLQLGNVTFMSCQSGHLVSYGLVGTGGAPYTISGGAPFHMLANQAGAITLANSTVTLTGTPAFSGVFAQVGLCGIIQANGATFNGAATGARYSAVTNGVILTGGAGQNFLPGSTAGSVSSGGQYV